LTDNSDSFEVKIGEEFTIKLESNPTTGYKWQPIFDDSVLTLISTDFISISNRPGASGMQRFNFKALKANRTSIKMVYKRGWEKEHIKEKEFSVNVA
jgi:inhibitor of cysteine peptidase